MKSKCNYNGTTSSFQKKLSMIFRKEFSHFLQAGTFGRASSLALLARIHMASHILHHDKGGKQTLSPFVVVHRKEFESLAFGSVDQRSIQLS